MNRQYYWIDENGSICNFTNQAAVNMHQKAWVLDKDDVIIFAANDVESLYKHFYSASNVVPLLMPYFSSKKKPSHIEDSEIYFYTFNVVKRKDKPLTKNMGAYSDNSTIYRQQVLQNMSNGAVAQITEWITDTYTILLISARELSVPGPTNLGSPSEWLYFQDHVNPPQYLGYFPKTTDVGVRYKRIVERLFKSNTVTLRDKIFGIKVEHKLYSAGLLGCSKNFD